MFLFLFFCCGEKKKNKMSNEGTVVLSMAINNLSQSINKLAEKKYEGYNASTDGFHKQSMTKKCCKFILVIILLIFIISFIFYQIINNTQ